MNLPNRPNRAGQLPDENKHYHISPHIRSQTIPDRSPRMSNQPQGLEMGDLMYYRDEPDEMPSSCTCDPDSDECTCECLGGPENPE